jgi:hypothetical protein
MDNCKTISNHMSHNVMIKVHVHAVLIGSIGCPNSELSIVGDVYMTPPTSNI